MPLYPLFILLFGISVQQHMWWAALGFGMVSYATGRCGHQLAHLGVICLLIVAWWHVGTSPPITSSESFSIESRRENGESVRLYGTIRDQAGVLIGRTTIGRPGQTCDVRFEAVPFQPKRNSGGFDERQWALGNDYSFKGELLTIHHCVDTKGLSGAMLRFKERRLQHVERTYDADVALYIEALLFGESRLLDEATSFSFRVTGLLHLLVISGSHITLIVYGLDRLLQPLPLRRETKTFMVLLSVTSFCWLTGFSPPVARAVLVADVLLCARLFGWTVRDPLHLLGWCSATLLAFEPSLYFNIGFQLTVGMTSFLLLTRPLWKHVLELATYAQAFGLIILWPVQSIMSVLAPVYNVVLGLAMSWVVLPCTILTYVFPAMSPLLQTLIHAIDGIFSLDARLRLWVPLHDVTSAHALLLLLGLWVGLRLLERARIMGLLVMVGSLLLVHVAVDGTDQPRVTFLDVGQGDAIVIEQAGIIGMIDVGGVFVPPGERRSTFDPGADVVAPYVWKRGERALDFVLLTHADHDHIGGLKGLLETIPVREVWVSGRIADESKRNELLTMLNQYPVHVRTVKAGDRPFPWMWIVAPDGGRDGSDENEASVACYLSIGALTYLLTGDLPMAQETEIPALDVDVFKLGHHGSNTSSGQAFLDRIDPEWVIISVGQHNRYGHPHAETLERVSGRHVLRTDHDGMVVCQRICEGFIK